MIHIGLFGALARLAMTIPHHLAQLATWAQYASQCGLPVMQRDEATIPADVGRGLRITAGERLPLWTTLSGLVAQELGLPNSVFAETVVQAAAKAAS